MHGGHGAEEIDTVSIREADIDGDVAAAVDTFMRAWGLAKA